MNTNYSFIDRYDELAIISSLLDALKDGESIHFPLREYVGIGGIGKTALLNKVRDECNSRELPHLFIDYRDFADIKPVKTLQKFVEELANKFLLQSVPNLEQPIKEFLDDISSSINLLNDLSDSSILENIFGNLSRFLTFFNSLNGALILDSLHLAPQNEMEFIGREILFPLAKDGNILILLGSRSRVDWGKPKYRIWRRTKSTALLTFPLKHTVEQVEERVDYLNNIGADVHRITCGHPQANDIVVQVLNSIQDLEAEKFNDYEARLVAAVVDTVIEGRIIPPNLFKSFCYLSVFRHVYVDTPPEILVKIDGSKNWSDPMEMFRLISSMQEETDLVIRSDQGESWYDLDEFVRGSLSLYLRFTYPKDYLEISKIAITYYERKFHENPTSVHFLVEKIYHYIDVLHMSSPSKTDLDTARQVYQEFKKDLELTMAGPFYLSISSNKIRQPRIPEASERQLAFEKLRKILRDDQELNERIGDTWATQPSSSFLLNALDDLWQELRGAGIGVLEILKHYKPATIQEDEPDHYDVLFRAASEAVGISRRIEITTQTQRGIRKSLQAVQSEDELMQFGLNLQARLPADLQRMLKQHTESLIIDVNDTSIPWELLHDGRSFMALRIPLGKRIRTLEVPRLNEESKEIRALVIGVPSCPKTKLPSLEYVEEEIEALVSLLRERNGIEFDPANDLLFGQEADVWNVGTKLTSGKYKIIHFAGHGLYNSESESERGLCLYDGLLKLEDIKNGLRGRPLVVLNTCQSALSKSEFIETGYRGVYTSGLASAFIVGGASACIANIWQIQDQQGFQFITALYEELLKGATIGESLRRTKVKKSNIDARAWAGYTLFGDPTKKIIE
jgi:CHAT domain-containing protein